MDYSLVEQVLLNLSEFVFETYHAARERPRSFWGAWTLAFGAAALLLLHRPPRVTHNPPRPPQRERGRG